LRFRARRKKLSVLALTLLQISFLRKGQNPKPLSEINRKQLVHRGQTHLDYDVDEAVVRPSGVVKALRKVREEEPALCMAGKLSGIQPAM
jgi:hypothetical protein